MVFGFKKNKTIQNEPYSFVVQEAYTKDVGRGVARIDYDSMNALNASTDDVIEIKGRGKTVAKCLPLFPQDEGKGIIRIDGLERNNSGIAIGDTITVRKIKAIAAEKVVVEPIEPIPPIDEGYLKESLQGKPLIKEENVMVPYFGGRLIFQVIGVTPAADAVLVTQKTVFHIAENFFAMAEEESNKRNYGKAIEFLDNILYSKPHDLDALWRKALCLKESGNLKEATDYCNKYLEIDPNSISVLIEKGFILMCQGNYESAKDCFRKVIELDPQNEQALSILKHNFSI